jgi:hypothetical protein
MKHVFLLAVIGIVTTATLGSSGARPSDSRDDGAPGIAAGSELRPDSTPAGKVLRPHDGILSEQELSRGEITARPGGGAPTQPDVAPCGRGGDSDCPYPGATGAYCTGDIDGDCDVDKTDLALCYMIPPPGECDVDGDGDIDLLDLALMIEQIGDDCNSCLNPGESGQYCTGDIEDYDCVVGLADLSKLLSNYGATTGMTRWDGDIEPPGGDGDVDLNDLAVLLSQYGDDCN